MWKGQQRTTGYLANFLVVRNNFASRTRKRSFQFEGSKLSMHRAARSDSFDNFLSQIAPFCEIKRTGKSRFLWQITIPNICSELRDAARDTEQIQRSVFHWCGTRCSQDV